MAATRHVWTVKYSLGLVAFALAFAITCALLIDKMSVGSLLKFLGAWFGISALIAIVIWLLGHAVKHKQQ
jgi:hypothetical protein